MRWEEMVRGRMERKVKVFSSSSSSFSWPFVCSLCSLLTDSDGYNRDMRGLFPSLDLPRARITPNRSGIVVKDSLSTKQPTIIEKCLNYIHLMQPILIF
jgi:hypothetical protein